MNQAPLAACALRVAPDCMIAEALDGACTRSPEDAGSIGGVRGLFTEAGGNDLRPKIVTSRGVDDAAGLIAAGQC